MTKASWIPGLCGLILLLTGCDFNNSPASSNTPFNETLTFNYRVLPSSPDEIRRINERLQGGSYRLEEPDIWAADAVTCTYSAQIESDPSQYSPDRGMQEHTAQPWLGAYGQFTSRGFNFYLDAFRARNTEPVCGSLALTVQGIMMISSPGLATSEWRQGATAAVIFRPELGPDYLGKTIEYVNELGSQHLAFNHAIDTQLSGSGYVSGRFQFIATNKAGDQLVVVTDGKFVMADKQ